MNLIIIFKVLNIVGYLSESESHIR